MKIDCKILRVYQMQTRNTKNGEYKFIPIDIEWKELAQNSAGAVFFVTQQTRVNVMKKWTNFSLKPGLNVRLDIRFRLVEYEGGSFPSLTCNYICLNSQQPNIPVDPAAV